MQPNDIRESLYSHGAPLTLSEDAWAGRGRHRSGRRNPCHRRPGRAAMARLPDRHEMPYRAEHIPTESAPRQ
ncbi:hypothetical protein AZ20_1482 [Bordetella bronchiseptica E014]|nr:hypothetical protein L530_1554 [Bordetella bronchiseptica MO211]KAK78110.1 hypothetical protein L507_1544 [Bordetella bronchiseptica CA90 BB02]KCV41642.1 hypothetical protein L572_1677 [Bordetella bronchiseptica 345]KCV55870.1 hypothetical protein L492_1569 [Bordetella bronchiseptica 7E71]KDC16388.1 hypothetical protein L542_1596 [Bordetella bronchiseptica F-1]KDC18350.1 hypothetical protein AZ20_1482 [Bordetella bronchiseptica E014]KDC28336.1 hypothetical protein L505_1631 [Bordetella bro